MKPMVKEMRARAERKKDRERREQFDEETTHQKQLKELEEEDKEFVDFLRQEEPELLNFGDDGLGGDEEDDLEDVGGGEGREDLLAGAELPPDFAPETVERILRNAFQAGAEGGGGSVPPSANSLRSAAAIFRTSVLRLYTEERRTMQEDPAFLVQTIQTIVRSFAQALDQFLGRSPGGTLPKKCTKSALILCQRKGLRKAR